MNICILQHVPFEGAGSVLAYFQHSNTHSSVASALQASHQYSVKIVHMYNGESLPPPEWPDLLVVLGGPMGVNDDIAFPWLTIERDFIRHVIDSGASLLGICLGAQLIAGVLGAEVKSNPQREIGWFPVDRHPDLNEHWLGAIFNDRFDSLHWHSDTFELPAGALKVGSTEACENQGYVVKTAAGGEIIGLQFHLEFSTESVQALVTHCEDDIRSSALHPWVQMPHEMLAMPKRFDQANKIMEKILTKMEHSIRQRDVLHPQLKGDCYLLAESNRLWVLLHKNAVLPWFIVVPKGGYRDLDDLAVLDRNRLFELADALSGLLRTRFSSEKINIAALGNMVPQLHLHVIGRHSQDVCWPAPVWGNISEVRSWSEEEVDVLSDEVGAFLSDDVEGIALHQKGAALHQKNEEVSQ